MVVHVHCLLALVLWNEVASFHECLSESGRLAVFDCSVSAQR